MKEHHKEMVELLENIKEKSEQRDKLISRLEVSIDNMIQKDLDEENNISEEIKESHNTFNVDRYNDFLETYEEAVLDGCETFEFEGREVWVGFAKTVIDQVYPGFRDCHIAKKKK